MKYTLLDLVQTIASSLDSDEVNSINDSVESKQIATLVRSVYFDIINRSNLPENYSIVNLDPSIDSTKPTLMYTPSEVEEIKWLKYNNYSIANPVFNMQEVKYIPIVEMLDMLDLYNPTDANVGNFVYTKGGDSYTIQYRNDKAPQYYSSFDDATLIFDSYDKAVDTTLQRSKTRAYAKLVIPFNMTDSFIPNLDEPQFALLLNEAKSLAWAELKQSANPKAEQSSKRGWVSLGKLKTAAGDISDFDQLPYYGKK